MILADLQQVDSRIGKVAKKAEMARDKASINEYKLLKIVKEALDNEKFASTIMDQLSPDELKLFKTFNLLTAKPVIYVGNVAESAYADPLADKYFSKVNEYAQSQGAQAIAICASTEAALVSEPAEDRKEYLEAIGAKETGWSKSPMLLTTSLVFVPSSQVDLMKFVLGLSTMDTLLLSVQELSTPIWKPDSLKLKFIL